MKRLAKTYGCPMELALDVLGGKWKTVILGKLTVSPMAYGELRRDIPTLSDKMLSERLHDLTEAGLVARSKGGGRDRYALTALGETLRPVLIDLYAWGQTVAETRDVRFRHPPGDQPADAPEHRLRAV